MRSIDERVVDMQFNNQQFERGIRTSVKSLDELNRGLKLDGASKSLSELSRAGRTFSLGGMSDGINALTNRFSTLGIVGITVIQNITNSALNAGKRILSALTIDPIKTGLQEYETKMGAIQTILTNTASKGTTLADVNATLNELNEYSDKTIYNFAEMARNIGTFTAAGVDLKESAIAIKGIANLAAGSGSTSQQASTAMYQLSQALAAGSVKLMDWNSVVNAGMGGELFQNALKDTAKQMGIVVDASIPFRETLQDGWITADVLTKTLAKFAEDESLVKAATEVKTLTMLIDTMKESVQSGWAQSWENIIGDKAQSTAFFTAISDGFSAATGASADARNEMLAYWNSAGGRTAIIQSLSNALSGLASIIKPIEEAFREIFPAMTGKRLVEISERIREVTAKFKIGEKTAANIKSTFKGLFSILDIGRKVVVGFASGLGTLIKRLLPAGDGLLVFSGGLGAFFTDLNKSIKVSDAFSNSIDKIGEVIKKRFGKIGEVLQKVAPVFYKLASIIGGAFDRMRQTIVKAFDNAEYDSIFDMLNSGLFAAILFGIKKFIDSLTSITDSAGGFLGGITGILDGVKGSLQAYQSQLKAGTLLKIAIAIGILAAALVALALIDSAKLTSSLAAMSVMFIELFASMAVFEMFTKGPGLFAMAKITTLMIGLSIAILILSGAMTKLADLDWGGIAKGLIGVGVLAAELALFMKVTNLSAMGVTAGLGLIALAAAIAVLAIAVRKFSEIDTGGLVKGLIAVGVILAELALFVNLTGDAKRVISTAIGLTILGGAMLIFAQAVEKMGSLSWEETGKGLLTMAGALTIITVALNLLPKNIFLLSLGMLDMAGAIMIMSAALKKMGELSWEEIGRAMVGLVGSLGIMLIAFKLMKSSFIDASALVLVIASIFLLANALKTLGSLSLTQVGIALLALAGTFAVIGVAGALLAPLIPVLMGLSLTLGIFGVAVLAVGAGVLALSAGLTALAVGGTAAGTAIIAILSGAIGLIPFTFRKLAEGIIEFTKILQNGIPTMVEAAMELVMELLAALTKYIPQIVDAGVKLLLSILKGIADNIEKVIVMATVIIVNFISGISKSLPKVIQSGFDLMLAFINGLADGVRRSSGLMIKAMQNLISAIIEAGIKPLTMSIGRFVDVGKNIVTGLINGIKSMISSVSKLASGLGTTILNSAKKALGIKSPSKLFDEIGKNIGLGLTNGLTKSTPKAVEASTEMSENVTKAATKTVAKTAKKTVEASNEVAKEAFDKAVEWIDERKYYNKLSLNEELAAWERVQSRYLEGTEERKKIDREVYRLKKEMLNKQEQLENEASKKQYNNSIEWIDERKYYNELSLTEELAAWQRVQSRYLANTDERKKADREVYRVKQEISNRQKQLDDDYYANTKTINDRLKQDIQSVTDAYDSALVSRTDSLYSSYGLFDELSAQEPVDGEVLIKNLDDQVNAFAGWKQSLTELAGKGIDAQLIKELEEMGPKSATQIDALNSLSSDRLDTYVSLWRTKHTDAKTQAISELEGLRIETANKISELNSQARVELRAYKDTWIEQSRLLSKGVKEEINSLSSEVQNATASLRKETEKEFVTLTNNIQLIVNTTDWYSVGVNIIAGMTKGIKDKAVLLANEAANAAYMALKAAKAALRIKSPSQAFAEIGMYADEGFADGLQKYSTVVESSARGVGETAIESLKGVMSKIVDAVNGDLDLSPTIRPVLDLTDVESGKKSLNGIFGEGGMSVTNGRASSLAKDFKSTDSSTLSKVETLLASLTKGRSVEGETKTVVSFEGVFKGAILNVRSEMDIEKIANKLYQLERSVSRPRGLVKA